MKKALVSSVNDPVSIVENSIVEETILFFFNSFKKFGLICLVLVSTSKSPPSRTFALFLSYFFKPVSKFIIKLKINKLINKVIIIEKSFL